MRAKVQPSLPGDRAGRLPPVGIQQELNRLCKVAQTFILGFALSIGAGDFQAGRPKTAFVRLALMNDRSELFHTVAIIVRPFWRLVKARGVSKQGRRI